MFLTDESVSGDPLEYLTVQDLYNGLRDVITVPNSVPAGTDRLFSTDESASGDPVEFVTVSQLLDSIREVRTTENATPADTDRIFLSDESASGDPIEYIEASDLRTYMQEGVPGTVTAGTTTEHIFSETDFDTTVAHGLGAQPSFLDIYLECTVEERGYSVGDRVRLDASQAGVGSLDYGAMVVATTTNIIIRAKQTPARIYRRDDATAGAALLNRANWKLVVVPYLVN